MSAFADLEAIIPRQIWRGVVGRVVEGDRLTAAVVELEPGGVVPEHRHDNEQLGIVLTGSVSFTIAGETRQLGPGGTYRIPGGAPHSVDAGPEGAVVVDIFSPPRADWDDLERLAPTRPRWP